MKRAAALERTLVILIDDLAAVAQESTAHAKAARRHARGRKMDRAYESLLHIEPLMFDAQRIIATATLLRSRDGRATDGDAE